jgi:hypothetical protein
MDRFIEYLRSQRLASIVDNPDKRRHVRGQLVQ